MHGLCSSKRVPCWCSLAGLVKEVLPWPCHHKNLLCHIHLFPHMPVVLAHLHHWYLLTWKASVMWLVINKCMNSVNNIVHRIVPHCQWKDWADGFLPKCVFCGALAVAFQDIRLMLPSDMFHSSGKLTAWNQCLPTLQSNGIVVYTTGAPPSGSHINPFFYSRLPPLAPHLTSCGALGQTMLLLPTYPHPQHFLPTYTSDTVTLCIYCSSHSHWSSLVNAAIGRRLEL